MKESTTLDTGTHFEIRKPIKFEKFPDCYTPGKEYVILFAFYTSSTHKDGSCEYVIYDVNANRSDKLNDVVFRDENFLWKALQEENIIKIID